MNDYDEPDVLLYEATGYYADLDMVLTGTFVPKLCSTIWLNMRDLSAHSERKYGDQSKTLLHFVSGQFFVADVQFADFHSEYCAALEDPESWSTKDSEEPEQEAGLFQIVTPKIPREWSAFGDTTEHLLSSPANAERLKESMRAVANGEYTERELIEPDDATYKEIFGVEPKKKD